MLNRLDDYPIHQTPEPLAHPITSDRNVYDRTWYNGYATDGSYYFSMGMSIYPNREILDCAFSLVRPNGLQHCFLASRRAPAERTEMQAGPLRLEVLEPMRRARLILDDNPSGLACDLSFEAHTSAIQEGRQTLWQGVRRIMDATRFTQFGCWRGTIATPDGDLDIRPELCRATKDRSWGQRGVGDALTHGAPQPFGNYFFLWAPVIWSDHVSHAIFFDGIRGEALFREALTAPWYANPGELPPEPEAEVNRMASTRHQVRYHPGSRLAREAEIDLVDLDGHTRTMTLSPILRFHMKGLGYGHPKWRQGAWQDELAIGHERFDPRELDLLSAENVHVQQVVRVEDGEQIGIGALEQLVIGPYAPAGFTQLLDGAD